MGINETIPEANEQEEDRSSLINEQNSVAGHTLNLVELYKRIDQEELEKLGVPSKQEVSE